MQQAITQYKRYCMLYILSILLALIIWEYILPFPELIVPPPILPDVSFNG